MPTRIINLDDEVINARTKAVSFGLEGNTRRAAYYRQVADNLAVTRDAIETDRFQIVGKS